MQWWHSRQVPPTKLVSEDKCRSSQPSSRAWQRDQYFRSLLQEHNDLQRKDNKRGGVHGNRKHYMKTRYRRIWPQTKIGSNESTQATRNLPCWWRLRRASALAFLLGYSWRCSWLRPTTTLSHLTFHIIATQQQSLRSLFAAFSFVGEFHNILSLTSVATLHLRQTKHLCDILQLAKHSHCGLHTLT